MVVVNSQTISAVIKGLSIISSAIIVPFLVGNFGVDGFANFSLAVATIYVVATIDLGIANLLNSTSRYDIEIVEERLKLAKFILLSILIIYLVSVFLVWTLFSNLVTIYNFFNLFWVMMASYLVILNNLGMKFLLMNEKITKFQRVGPTQQIAANLFILGASSHLELQMILYAYFFISNFFGGAIFFSLSFRKTLKLNTKSILVIFRKNIKSLLNFQYLQLLAIFNSQGIVLVISRYFSLEIVAFYSLTSRLFQSVNQIYTQLTADYWNQVSRFVHNVERNRLQYYYRLQIKKSMCFGIFVNGSLLLFGSRIIDLFLSVDYNFVLFLSLSLFWTCTLVFLPIAHSFNGLLNVDGGLLWQTLFSVTSVVIILLSGLLNFSLSLGMLILSAMLGFFIIPLSHKKLEKIISNLSDTRRA